jgi:hypothetical protein
MTESNHESQVGAEVSDWSCVGMAAMWWGFLVASWGQR